LSALDRFPRGPRNALMVTAHGATLSLSEWSRRTGIHHLAIRRRLLDGWEPEAALGLGPRSKNGATWQPPIDPDRLRALYDGGKTLVEVAAELGVTEKVISTAMRRLGFPRRVAAKRDQRGPRNHTGRLGRHADR